ncbi:hypothetical protein BSL78_27765 [Apostichopus japonicus]|uniref:Kazal-like domain-containing protein n=1 Tax=Stichopus japonicus TaxID=307972 RepID=A0A2G8JI52_STIJA|nr:hypothetical protein BSL78_27765 [Apostichopus japonicus]
MHKVYSGYKHRTGLVTKFLKDHGPPPPRPSLFPLSGSAPGLYSKCFITSMYTIGFTCGYFLASLCLRIPYVLFTTDVEVEPDKLPGAWWLGYLILSMLTFLSSLLYFVFPTALPVHVDELEGGESKPLLSVDEGALPSNQARGDNFVGNPSVVDENIKQTDASFTDGLQRFWEGTKAFCRSVYRIVTNPVIILMSLMGGIISFGSEAFATFTPLYVQNYFNLTPSVASMLTGIQTFFGYIVGQLLGAILIRHWNLNKLQCAIFYSVGVTLFCLGPTASVFFSCPDEKIIGHNEHTVSTNSFSNGVDLLDCNANCGCSGDFSPVCGIDGFSYMSPCHAGCREFLFSNDQVIFYNCSCVNPSPSVNDYYDNNRELQEGLCSEVCPTWIYYAVVWVISLFIISAASNSPVIVILRSVAEEDRALTFTFINWTKRVLGFIPGPLISGIIIDQACLISSNSCGSGPSSGNCLLYDKQMLRKRYNILPVVCFWLSCIFSVMITIIVWRQTKQQDRKRDETPQVDETSAM